MIRNRLTGDAFTLKSFNSVNTWNAGPGTTLSDGGFTELSPNLGCRQIELTGGTLNSISLNPLPGDASFFGGKALFVFAIKIPNGGVVSVSIDDLSVVSVGEIYEFPINASSPSINAEGIASPQWSIVRVLTTQFISPTPTLAISINVTKNQNETIYFTSPVLVPQIEFLSENYTLQYVGSLLPQFMIEDDFETTEPIDLPLHRFIDVATVGLDEAVTQTLGMAYLDKSFGRDELNADTKSTLIDPSVALSSRLLWLCKFVGTKPVTRFSTSQETATDPIILDASLLNSLDTLRLTSYLSLNPPPLDAEAQRGLLAWQVETKSFGFNAGTVSSIVEAVKLMLVGDKDVILKHNYAAEPFVIQIRTRWYETLGADESSVGQSSQLVLEAAAKAKPIGVVLTHSMTL